MKTLQHRIHTERNTCSAVLSPPIQFKGKVAHQSVFPGVLGGSAAYVEKAFYGSRASWDQLSSDFISVDD